MPSFPPLAASPPVLVLAALLFLLVALVELGVVRYATAKMGIERRYLFTFLLVSLLASHVDIPIARLAAEVPAGLGSYHALHPIGPLSGTMVAVNAGGALVPIALSLYLTARNGLWLRALVGTAVVSALVHLMAHPVPGVGIAVPVFIPPMIAALVALALSRRAAGPLAYASGSLGTLVGADLLNFDDVRALGAPAVSIGGAGTFDGIFLTGLLAVVVAGVAGDVWQRRGAVVRLWRYRRVEP